MDSAVQNLNRGLNFPMHTDLVGNYFVRKKGYRGLPAIDVGREDEH